jgi:homoserine dehydrogenase
MRSDRLRVGLIGWGTVGAALGELVLNGPLPLDLVAIGVRHPGRQRGVATPEGVGVGSPDAALAADIVVELAGGIDGPFAWARRALDAGTPYVTANKALLATHGEELARLATERSAALLASASVGGGTPMIETVTHVAASGGIERLRGVVNATATFILGAMGDGRAYDDALREAQAAGYAEADPSLDVEGRDAAQKLAILSSVAWGTWRAEAEVETTGIVGLEVGAGEIHRLIAEATPDSRRVAPVVLDEGDPLAGVTGIENMLEIVTRDGATVRVSGPGAGGPVSARAVYADLARLVAGERPILFA